jgi:hypothetical protein
LQPFTHDISKAIRETRTRTDRTHLREEFLEGAENLLEIAHLRNLDNRIDAEPREPSSDTAVSGVADGED